MLTEKDYCDKDTSFALQELGYNPYMFYDDGTPAIHLWDAQKWLREEKKIGVFVSGFKNGYTFWVNNLLNGDTLYQGFFDNQTCEKYKSYEEALSEGTRRLLNTLK